MTGERIRVGIVGANIGPERESWGVRAHLPALVALPEIEVVAVCTTRRSTAEATAHRFAIPQAFDDLEAMLEDGNVDVVDVCVTARDHHELVGRALAAGKHVFCEWPLAATLEDAEDLAAKAQRAGTRHMVGLQARFAPVYAYMRDLIAEGYVGTLLSCTANGSMGMPPPGRTSPLVLIHAGHVLDTLFTVVADELDEASSIVSMDTAANHFMVLGHLTGGAFVAVTVRHIPAFASGFTLELNGTDGTLVASVDGAALGARDIRSLGEQINQTSLRGARRGQAAADMEVPASYRWVPGEVPPGPPLSVAQAWRRFVAGILGDSHAEPDFATAVERHRLIDLLGRRSMASLDKVRER